MRRLVTILAVALVAASCTTGTSRSDIVATTTILGDVTSEIVDGCGVEVSTLMPIGQDPHAFQPSANQAAAVRSAALVIANGLGLEQSLEAVLEGAEEDGVPVLRVGATLDPVPFDAHPSLVAPLPHDEDEREVGHLDPHVWMDPVRMADGVDRIADAAAEAFPEAASCITDRAATYRSEVLDAHQRIATILATIPPERRTLVTNHHALGYFADRYDLKVLGAVVPSGSTLAEPSPKDLEDLVVAIREAGVDVIFAETTEPAKLAEAVAAEVGYPVEVVELFTGSLGPEGSGAETYLGMLEVDARRIAAALSD